MSSNEQLIPRSKVIERMNISDSTERRMRKSGQSWPAHVRVGHRVLYRESGIAEWVAAQESIGDPVVGGMQHC